mgnify:CR=1 FL=1
MREWLATAPFGLEGVVAEELRALSMENVRAGTGGARFTGTEADAFKANLWLRTADRVLLVVGQLEAKTFDALFEGVKALPWEDLIPGDARFPVSGNCARSQLMSVSDCQAITKKAVVERLKAKRRVQTLPETAETYAVQVALHQDVATLTLDASGAGLSRRGYRTWNGEAPLRETLAAALVTLSPWRPGQMLHDPLCGTGTLLVEAAFVAANRAPGLERAFACEAWRWMPRGEMHDLRGAARDAVRLDAVEGITGADRDEGALELARRHLKQAGLWGRIDLRREEVQSARLPQGRGVVLTNPPYGERLSDKKGCEQVARALGRLQGQSGWTVCAITGDRGFERVFGRRADKRRRLYNGRLECEFMTFYAPRAGGERKTDG